MDRHISSLVPIQWDKGGSSLGKKMPIFYSALLLTGVNLLLRMVSTSFQCIALTMLKKKSKRGKYVSPKVKRNICQEKLE